MSILSTNMLSIPPIQAADPPTQINQSRSGTSPNIRRRGWWSWFDRQDESIALREIADDQHLLNDLGLTRDEALREAAKSFWR